MRVRGNGLVRVRVADLVASMGILTVCAVKVVVRVRPFNNDEVTRRDHPSVTVWEDGKTVQVRAALRLIAASVGQSVDRRGRSLWKGW